MNTPILLNELRPRACLRIRALPVFGPMFEDLLKWFQDQGYTTSTIYNHIQGIDELVRLLKRRPEGLIRLDKAQLDAAYDYFHH